MIGKPFDIDWDEMIAEFKASGLTQKRFCADKPFSASTFSEKRKRAAESGTLSNTGDGDATASDEEPARFIRVDEPTAPPTPPEIVIELPHGIVIRISGLGR